MEIFAASAFWVILLIVQAIACAALSGYLANQKGYNGESWGFIGFFLGIFGVIAAAGLPVKNNKETLSKMTKKCPDCAEIILKEAIVCKFCGKKFSKELLVKELGEQLQDKSISNEEEIIEMLAFLKEPNVIPYILEFYDNINADYYEQTEAESLLDKALSLLKEIGTKETYVELAKQINKPRIQYTKAAKILDTIHQLNKPEVLPYIIEFIEKVDSKNELKVHLLHKAIAILKETGKPEIAPKLISILEKTESNEKAELIIKLLGSLKNSDSMPVLINALKKKGLKYFAGNSLKNFGEKAIPYLEQLAEEGTKKDKKIAEEIIAEIRSSQESTQKDI